MFLPQFMNFEQNNFNIQNTPAAFQFSATRYQNIDLVVKKSNQLLYNISIIFVIIRFFLKNAYFINPQFVLRGMCVICVVLRVSFVWFFPHFVKIHMLVLSHNIIIRITRPVADIPSLHIVQGWLRDAPRSGCKAGALK